MTEEEFGFILFLLAGIIVLLVYLAYIKTIRSVLEMIGLTGGEASTIILITLMLGWISVPLFPYNGWWIGISIGGALIPIILCGRILWNGRVGLAEAAIGIIIVAYVTYFITRPEEGVGIVADIQWAFAPALAAGLYSMSTFWMDMSKAAPLAYVSGVLGTLVGADVFHLAEILSYDPPSEGLALLSIGGANIFDMVYLTGIVAVVVAIVVYKARRRQEMYGVSPPTTDYDLASTPPRDTGTTPSRWYERDRRL